MQKKTGSLQLWWNSISGTPLGSIACGVSENGLAAVIFGKDVDIGGGSMTADYPASSEIEQTMMEAFRQIKAYLEGDLQVFDLLLDMSSRTDFQKLVLDEVNKIPYGQVITYGKIAEKVGGSKHVRAVGGAVGSNPLPLVVPCHRVVSTGGHLRGYSGWGGIRTKAWLLQLEGQQLLAEDVE